MKITEDILKALQNCIHGIGSINEFSQQTNVNIETISKYLSRKSQSIKQETWEKLYPLLKPYLPRNGESKSSQKDFRPPADPAAVKIDHKHTLLSSDVKILLDAFAELSPEIRTKKLIEIVELARQAVLKNRSAGQE
jgi:hypothetical protein